MSAFFDLVDIAPPWLLLPAAVAVYVLAMVAIDWARWR